MSKDPFRILLVDDDKIDQKAVVRFVKKERLPYDIEIAANLAAAREKLERRSYDLMLLDYLLPDGTGLDLLSESEIPAIILTGCGSELVAAEAMRKGAYDYLAKDAERNYLLLMPHTIEQALARKATEDRLRRLEQITNISTDMFAIVDRNFTYLAANPAYLATVGKSYDELIGHTAREVFGVKFFNEVIEPNAVRCMSGEEVNYQRWFDFPAAGRRYMDVHYYPDVTAAGNVVGYVINERDITEREEAEELLLQEAMFRKSVIERAAEGLCVCHEIAEFPFVRFTVWNERMAGITGYTMEEINRKGWYQSLYPDPEYQQKAKARMDAMRQGRDLLSEEWNITRADKSKKTVLISSSTLMHASGKVEVLALVTDISERKRAEEAISEARDKLEKFFSLVPDLICVATTEGHFKKLNPEWEKVLGYRPDEMLDRPFVDFIHPDDIEPTFSEVRRQIAGQRTLEFINRYRHKEGGYRWLEWVAAPAENGEVLFAAARDITERIEDEGARKMLVDCMGEKIGKELFDAVANGLCDWAGMDCAIVGELVGENRVQALGMHMGGEPVEGFSYELAGTPCENVTEQGLCEYPEGIVKMFPEDTILAEMGAEGYIGTPLRDKRGNTLGVLCALSRRKLALPGNIREVLQIIASRAAAEIERLRAEKELQTRLDEIERMNKLMVGRELKMEELRRQNKRLKEDITELQKSGMHS